MKQRFMRAVGMVLPAVFFGCLTASAVAAAGRPMAGLLETELCPKWIQEPDCEFGIDLISYAVDIEQGQRPASVYRVADDWVCDGRPITGIRWWGSYPGWADPVPPLEPSLGRPIAFRLIWYTDIPAGVYGRYSMPGDVLAEVVLPLGVHGAPFHGTGVVSEMFFCTVDGKTNPPGLEHEYIYEVILPEPWNEKEGNIYWLSIEAVFQTGYVPGPERPEWGWKTSTEMDIIDDAVVWRAAGMPEPPLWEELRWPTYPYPLLFYPPDATFMHYDPFVDVGVEGPSLNMAFELLTHVCPRRTAKWRQMPDMVTGTDLWSWRWDHSPEGSMYLRADDFVSDGRRITDIHWWGSYSNWMTQVDGNEVNPVPPPSVFPWRPLGFNLSWHMNDEDLCLPGAELTNLFVSIEHCHEMYYGAVTQFWVSADYYEHEYQYYVDLLAVAEPWLEVAGTRYWLNIEAVFDQAFQPGEGGIQDGHGGWGWKIAEPTDGDETCAPAIYERPMGPWVSDFDGLPEGHPRKQSFMSYDMAFELTTDEPPGPPAPSPIVITNLVAADSLGRRVIDSVGTSGAGVQYLESNTNLLTNTWIAVMSKPAPFPAPLTNTWRLHGVPVDSNMFYRIVEK